jgi:long-chain acyl-CoA synthetase
MIKSGGENVMAAEVEAALLKHPAVVAAAALGLPHARLGEQVAAAVVLRPPWVGGSGVLRLPADSGDAQACAGAQQQQQQQQEALSLAALQQHCRAAGLSPFKLPRVVATTAQLPLNSSGKVVKPALKQQLLQLASAPGSDGSSDAEAAAGGGGDVVMRSKL